VLQFILNCIVIRQTDTYVQITETEHGCIIILANLFAMQITKCHFWFSTGKVLVHINNLIFYTYYLLNQYIKPFYGWNTESMTMPRYQQTKIVKWISKWSRRTAKAKFVLPYQHSITFTVTAKMVFWIELN
jgi:hypothetical protein